MFETRIRFAGMWFVELKWQNKLKLLGDGVVAVIEINKLIINSRERKVEFYW